METPKFDEKKFSADCAVLMDRHRKTVESAVNTVVAIKLQEFIAAEPGDTATMTKAHNAIVAVQDVFQLISNAATSAKQADKP